MHTCTYPGCTSTDTSEVVDWSVEPPAYVYLCPGCDTAECPNQMCRTRTLKVNATNCPSCGARLMRSKP